MIRSFRLGDEEYIIQSHFAVYSKEYDFDVTFKDYIKNTIEEFSKSFDRDKENLWLIDMNGELKGSIGIVKFNDSIAQLRWFLVEPEARGQISIPNIWFLYERNKKTNPF